MKRIFWAATLLAGAMLFGGIARGGVILQTLDLTETSSTSLTVVQNGGVPVTVTSSGGNSWTLLIPLDGDAYWQEPGEATLNHVSGNSTELVITSDVTGTGPGLPSGTPDTTDFTINLGATATSVTVTFTDNGDAAVPEPSTLFAGALLLLPFGISALRGFRRNRAQ
jgi:hypothetical protein